ncbi:MAG: hypothetical protein QOJ97_1081 [Solirubrobacteraceae bacterium]|nr:hypothetical protein [Solirubrobacteraceae bacterium]
MVGERALNGYQHVAGEFVRWLTVGVMSARDPASLDYCRKGVQPGCAGTGQMGVRVLLLEQPLH